MRSLTSIRATVLTAVAVLALIGSTSRGQAQRAAATSACVTGAAPAAASMERTARRWAAPLDRTIGVREREIAMRTLLDRIASAGRFRLSYASDLLPLDKIVCAVFDSAMAGDVLAELLRETTLEPAAVGLDQVVLRPRTARRLDTLAPATVQQLARELEPVITDARRIDPGQLLPYASGSIPAAAIATGNPAATSDAFDGLVPGLWVWEQSPSSLVTHFGSIRGASSFGLSYPKMYIDGIEVADPLLLSGINAESIERIDVIRGPQGAALFGSGAISGVINVITRHDGASNESGTVGKRVTLQGQSAAGVSASDYTSSGVLSQQHGFSIRGGSALRTAGAGLSLRTLGDFVEGAASKQIAANAAFRAIGMRTSLDATARFFTEHAGSPVNPLLRRAAALYEPQTPRSGDGTEPQAPTTGAPVDSGQPQSVRQYTAGATGSYIPDGAWSYTATVGMDGYRLSGVPTAGVVSSSVDSALRAARGSADRATLRMVGTARFAEGHPVSTTLTLAGEHSAMREESAGDLPRGGPGAPPRVGARPATWLSNSGLSAQSTVAIYDALYLNAGARIERMTGYAGGDAMAFLPALGGAYIRQFGDLSVKVRTAYGRAIRPVEMLALGRPGNALAAIHAEDLTPETQAGIEGGLDLTYHGWSAHATRFVQTASGLLQSVMMPVENERPTGPRMRIEHVVENVGAISNTGWELESRAELGRLTVGGTLSFVDSRVRRTTAHYTGDLRTGDRVLEVPAMTASLTSGWTGARWSTSWSVSRAADWIGYDRVAMAIASAEAAAAGRTSATGTTLRSFWREYDGVTRLRGLVSRDINDRFTLQIRGENLLNYQRGEPDNATIVPGRTLTIGVKAKR